MKSGKVSIVVLAMALCSPGFLFADYTIVLENDRRITVKEHWEEGGMLKFPALGGEIGIDRGQIQDIFPARATEPQGIVINDLQNDPIPRPSKANIVTSSDEFAKVPPAPKIRRFEVEDEAEKDYQFMYGEIRQQIELRRNLRWLITRGTTNPEPTLIHSLRVLNARIDDLISRIKDSEHNPTRSRGTGIVNLEVGSPFGGGRMMIGLRHGGKIVPGRVIARPGDMARPGKVDFPKRVTHFRARVGHFPEYTYRQKVLSELRAQLIDFYEERMKLIEGMKQRGLFTGSVPFEDSP